MTPERVAPIRSHEVTETALHDEIKRRAYELYDRKRDDSERQDIKNELQAELPRVVYAAAHVQNSNCEFDEDRIVRAARVYLRALTSYIARF